MKTVVLKKKLNDILINFSDLIFQVTDKELQVIDMNAGDDLENNHSEYMRICEFYHDRGDNNIALTVTTDKEQLLRYPLFDVEFHLDLKTNKITTTGDRANELLDHLAMNLQATKLFNNMKKGN